MTPLYATSAAELTEAYAAGRLSPVEVTEAVLARIEAWEPHANAFYRVHHDGARAAAKAAEARWRDGRPLSPLDGVPITLKENVVSKGDPAPIGVAIGDTTPKTEDSPIAARVREAGCVLLGKTTMPDYGMLSSGRSSIHGTTRNPWRLDRNTAGSSSGAGAAAVAGYGPLHVGTDIGGSVRLPAHHCGLFGLKPSLGRIPIHPPFMGRCAGPMTRTVRDSAMLMSAITRPDARDYMSLPYDPVDYAAGLEGLSAKGLRIGLIRKMGTGLEPETGVLAAADAAARALADAGAEVVETPSFLTPAMLDGICRFFEARSYNDVMALSAEQRAKILPFVVEWCTWRAGGFSGAEVMDAYMQVVAMREAAVKAVAAFDFVLSPTAPIVSYPAEAHSPNEDPHDALAHIAYTVAYNFSEQPAASVNWCFTDDGLPVGVQLIGQRFDDLGVMRLARLVEQLRPAQNAWPEPPQ
ncbi:amidase [Thalassobaculum fulvum]|uniref:Amidase n=1 Tax=Thalassobaculum fulvum TaxID=1633335 RepID=A0A918XWB8_9PROT|nr:amidase [Thalassobaculum fulvum]GHD61175.1 amidase [Thalassobaculum fulvum]